MLDAILRWRSKWRRLAAHLEKNGVRAPATVVYIASWGSEHESDSGDWDLEDEMVRRMPGETLAPSNTANWYVRKTKLMIRPESEPEFEVERKMRYGDWGLDIPKAGDEIAVIYDPGRTARRLAGPDGSGAVDARAGAAVHARRAPTGGGRREGERRVGRPSVPGYPL